MLVRPSTGILSVTMDDRRNQGRSSSKGISR